MIIGFIIWSICAAIFLAIGICCRKSSEAVGFFSFAKTPKIDKVKDYNNAVSVLWFSASCALEIIGIPILFLKQNSPLFIVVVLAVMILVIAIIIVYFRIESKYCK